MLGVAANAQPITARLHRADACTLWADKLFAFCTVHEGSIVHTGSKPGLDLFLQGHGVSLLQWSNSVGHSGQRGSFENAARSTASGTFVGALVAP